MVREFHAPYSSKEVPCTDSQLIVTMKINGMISYENVTDYLKMIGVDSDMFLKN